MTTRRRLILVLSVLVIGLTIFSATGHHLDCQRGAGSTSFCALRTASGAGFSIQWGERQRVTVWWWDADGDNNRRVWPGE